MNSIKDISGNNLTVENFKEFILELERTNLKKLEKEDKKQMISKIIRTFEEAKKNDNN